MRNKNAIRKRIFSIILTIAVAMSMMPTMAWADTTTQSGNVAEVTSGSTTTMYAELADAFTEAQKAERATVTLLDNVTLEQAKGITLTRGNIILDLNGKKLSIAEKSNFSSGIILNASSDDTQNTIATLTIRDSAGNGAIIQPNIVPAIRASGEGTLIIESGTIQNKSSEAGDDKYPSCGVYVQGSGHVTISGGSIDATYQGININQYASEATLTVKGSPTIHGKNSYALLVATAATVQLSGGTYTTNENNGRSIWNSAGSAARLLASGYYFEDADGNESQYSGDNQNGVKGKTIVNPVPKNVVKYIDANGSVKTMKNCTPLTESGFDNATTTSDLWFVANKSFECDSAFSVYGTVNLILCDGVTVTLKKGIALSGGKQQNATLNIYRQEQGTGTLNVTGEANYGYAAIRNNIKSDATATLNIYGGIISAVGSSKLGAPGAPDSYGAGIGTSIKASSGAMNVNIKGGTVTAQSGEDAQAIGNGTNSTCDVTVTIADGMKCVKTDDPNTKYAYDNTDGTSITITKCENHVWTYSKVASNPDNNHTKICSLCSTKIEESHSQTNWVWDESDPGYHTSTCACGAKGKAVHQITWILHDDGLTHTKKCSVCNYAETAAEHSFTERETNVLNRLKCACGAVLAAEYNGEKYASIQSAINAAKSSGGTVELAQNVAENVTITDGIVIIDLNERTWEHADDSASSYVPLTVSGGNVTLKNGNLYQRGSTSKVGTGLVITGGSVTVESTTSVKGSGNNRAVYPAIDLQGGTLNLSKGVTLINGLKVPENEKLADYLPENTAFVKCEYGANGVTIPATRTYISDVYSTNECTEDMAIVAHKHSCTADKQTCDCGYTCTHPAFENGVCSTCGYTCPHTDVDETTAKCKTCGTTFVVKVTKDKTTSYSADLAEALNTAENGTTISLLTNVELDKAAVIREDGKIVILNLNGHSISANPRGDFSIGAEAAFEQSRTSATLKITGNGDVRSRIIIFGGTLDLSDWAGDTIDYVSVYGKTDSGAATELIVGEKAGYIGSLIFTSWTPDQKGIVQLKGGSYGIIQLQCYEDIEVKLGELLADGYAFKNIDDGSFVNYTEKIAYSYESGVSTNLGSVQVVKCPHKKVVNGTCVYCYKTGIAATVDGTAYESFEAALAAIKDSSSENIVLRLHDNAEYANTAINSNNLNYTKLTIDLNGYRLSGVNGTSKLIQVIDGAELVIKDSSESKTGFVDNIQITMGDKTDGKLTLESGTIGTLQVSPYSDITLNGGKLGYLTTGTDSQWTFPVAYLLQKGYTFTDEDGNAADLSKTSVGNASGGKTYEVTKISGADISAGSELSGNMAYGGSLSFKPSVNLTEGTSEPASVTADWYIKDGTKHIAAAELTKSGNSYVSGNTGETFDSDWMTGVDFDKQYEVFCVLTAKDSDGKVLWNTPVTGYALTVSKADIQNAEITLDNTCTFTPLSTGTGTEQEQDITVTHNGKTLVKDTDYTVSGNTATNAGEYKLTVTGIGGYTGTKKIDWSVQPRVIESVGISGDSKVVKKYDGTTAAINSDIIIDQFVYNTKLGETINFELVNITADDYKIISAEYATADVGNDKAFSYKVKIKNSNYKFEDGDTKEFTISEPGFICKIEKADAPAVVQGALTVVNNLKRTYTLDVSELLPKAPKGEYGTVEYKFGEAKLNDGYYTDGAVVSKEGMLTLPIDSNNVETTGSIGIVTVTVKTGNYADIILTVDVTARNKIKPVLEEGSMKLTPESITYGDKLSEVKISGTMKDGDKTVEGSFSWEPSRNTVLAAGTHEAEWRFTPEDTAEYSSVTGKVSVTVNKADPEITKAPEPVTGLEYTGIEQSLVTEGTTVNGTIVYSLREDGAYSSDIPTGTNAGTYTVWYKVVGDNNHNDVAPKRITVEIAKCKIGISDFAIAPKTYTNGDESATVTKVTFAKLQNGENLELGTDFAAAAKFKNANAGTRTATLTVTLSESAKAENYELEKSTIEKEFTIAQAEAPVLSNVSESVTYGDNTQKTVSVPAMPTDAGTLTYKEGSTSATNVDWSVGTDGTVKYKVSGANAGTAITLPIKISSTNYEDTTVNVVITIEKAAPSLEITNRAALNRTYDGTSVAAEYSTNGDGAVTFEYYKDDTKLNAAPTDAGTYKVIVSLAEGTNYEAAQAEAMFTIAKRSIEGAEISLGDELAYTGTKQAQSVSKVTITIGEAKLEVTYDVSENTGTNAGTYTLTVTGNGNFEGTATKAFKIKQAEVTLTGAEDNTLVQNAIYKGTEVTKATFKNTKVIVNFNEETKELEGVWTLTETSEGEKFESTGEFDREAVFTPADANFAPITQIVKIKVTTRSSGAALLPTTEVKTDDKTGTTGEKVTTSPAEVKNETRTDANGNQVTTAKVTVSAANQKEILKQAEANKSDEIIIKVSEKDVKDGAKLELSLDKTFIEDILNKTDADLTIQTPDGEKTFTQEELKKLADAATGSTITLDPAASTDPADPSEPTNPSTGENAKLIKGIQNTTIVLKSKILKNGKIRLTWTKSKGYKVDHFEVYRSVKKNSGYGKKAFFTTKSGSAAKYLNSKSVKKDKTYYYKLRGVRIIDGKKYYTKWSNKTWKTVN